MHGQLLLGAAVITIAVIVQATAFDYLARLLLRIIPAWFRYNRKHAPTLLIVLTVLIILAVHTLQVWMWALCFLNLGEFTELSTALYFSTVTFTSLGYGDITLSEDWQLLSALAAVNGILMFGWSTAFIFRVMTLLWERDRARWQGHAASAIDEDVQVEGDHYADR